MTVMSDFLGVEPDRRDEFRVWTLTRIMGMFDPKRNGTPEFVESTVQLRGYFSQRIADAQRAPVGGLVDRLVESGELSHDEMVDLLIIMLGAGIITTADLIGNTLHALLTTPGELDALRADRSLVPEAIEETLRFDSPALSAGRILTEDTELFGQPMPAGTWLRLMTAASGATPSETPIPTRTRSHAAQGVRRVRRWAAPLPRPAPRQARGDRRPEHAHGPVPGVHPRRRAHAGVAPRHPRVPRVRAPHDRRPVKIGINGNKFVATGDVALLAGHAGEAAAAGVDAYWLAQHPAGSLDALTALAIIGRDVPHLALGVGVVPVWGRHPAALAAQALTAAQGFPAASRSASASRTLRWWRSTWATSTVARSRPSASTSRCWYRS